MVLFFISILTFFSSEFSQAAIVDTHLDTQDSPLSADSYIPSVLMCVSRTQTGTSTTFDQRDNNPVGLNPDGSAQISGHSFKDKSLGSYNVDLDSKGKIEIHLFADGAEASAKGLLWQDKTVEATLSLPNSNPKLTRSVICYFR